MNKIGSPAITIMRIEFGMLFLLLCISEDTSSLKCHKCISLECPGVAGSEFACEGTKSFLTRELNNIYHNYGSSPIPFCPSPEDLDGWRNIQTIPSFTTSCPDHSLAQCSVGRFKVTTTITEGVNKNKNLTTYGTSLGCLEKASRSPNECSFIRESSGGGNNGMRHLLEIEHCRTSREMCQNSDFCINPEVVVVKKFRDDIVDNWKGRFRWVLVGSLILIIVVVVFCLLGIKYDGSYF